MNLQLGLNAFFKNQILQYTSWLTCWLHFVLLIWIKVLEVEQMYKVAENGNTQIQVPQNFTQLQYLNKCTYLLSTSACVWVCAQIRAPETPTRWAIVSMHRQKQQQQLFSVAWLLHSVLLRLTRGEISSRAGLSRSQLCSVGQTAPLMLPQHSRGTRQRRGTDTRT